MHRENAYEDMGNFHHFYYFWMVAREGSVTRASTLSRVAQPSVSSQLRALESALGHALFERRGRRLVITETGRTVYDYAEESSRWGSSCKMRSSGGRPRGRCG